MRRRYRRSYHSSRDIGHERALQHIEDARLLSVELGGTDQDVKKYFFSLSPQALCTILDVYGQQHGAEAQAYAQNTMERWRNGDRHMSGTVAGRLFALLPPRMPLPEKYRLIENLWNHVGPKSKKILRIGLDANLEQVLEVARIHIEEVVVRFKIPDNLEKRFNWLAAGDSHVKQDFLNHLRHMEKTLVITGARLQLPVMLEHLQSEAGRQTHRLTQVLKIGNHELDLHIDKNASGVTVVEPTIVRPYAVGEAGNYKWLWWVAAAIIIIYFLTHR